MIQAPQVTEHPPYYGRYTALVPPGSDLFALLAAQPGELRALLSGVGDDQASAAPKPGEWSIKEVIGHINDTERVMSFRAFWMARADTQPLPGFEQDDFVRATDFNRRSLGELLAEFEHLRQANVLGFAPLTEAEISRVGTASGGQFTSRALLYILAGHVIHHIESLKGDYQVGAG